MPPYVVRPEPTLTARGDVGGARKHCARPVNIPTGGWHAARATAWWEERSNYGASSAHRDHLDWAAAAVTVRVLSNVTRAVGELECNYFRLFQTDLEVESDTRIA